jgi:hypothetical protein
MLKIGKSFFKISIYFSNIYLFLLLDGNIDFRLLSKDIGRFLNSNLVIDELLYSIFYSLILFVFVSSYERINKQFNFSIIQKLYFIIFINASVFFSFIYLTRIYSISRLIIILYLFFNILITLILTNMENLNYKIKYIILLFPLFIIVLNFQSDVEVETSIAEKNIFSENIESKILNFNETEIKTVNHPNFILDKVKICCEEINFVNSGGKSVGQIEIINDKLFYFSGSGLIFNTDLDQLINKKSITWNIVDNNLQDLVKNKYIFDLVNWESIKGVKYFNNKIYIAYLQENKDNCVTVEVSVANLDRQLTFKKLFSKEECIPRTNLPYIAHQAGGFIEILDDTHLLLSTGDFRDFSKAQDLNSIFGKLLKVNIDSGNFEIIGYGVRNPQGIELNNNENFIIFTDHGPDGGDEINILDLSNLTNFGWPISSYGYHYDGSEKPEAPLNKSHADYGFQEPLIYFDLENNPNHGITDILKFPGSKDSYLTATLYGNLLYKFDLNLEKQEIYNFETFRIGERIRDIEMYNDHLILLLEDSPAIGILSFKN